MPDLPFRIIVTDAGTAVVRRFGAAVRKIGGLGRSIGRGLSRGFSLAQGAIGGAISRVFNLRNALLGLGVGLAIRKIVDTFGGFEKQMNTVRVLTQATTAEFEALTEQAKQLGATTKFSAAEAAEGMNFLAKAGFDANEVMQALPDTLTLAAAANLELGQSADIVTNILTGLQLPIEDLTKATDVLTQAFTSSNTDLAQLGQAFKFAGPLATTAGLEFEEVATVLAFLGNAGIQASMAGTTLRGAIAQLLKPSKEGAAVLDRLGVTVKTAEGNLRPFADIIEDLEPIAGNASDILAVFGRRASGIANVLKQGSGAFREFADGLRNSGGRAAEVAAAQMQGLTGAILRMKAAVEGAVIEIGDQLAPTLINAAEAIATFGQNVGLAIRGLSSASQEAGEASKNAFLDFIPSAEAMVRAIQGVRRAWIGLEIAGNLVKRAFLEVALFVNEKVLGPIQTAMLGTAELVVLTFNTMRRTVGNIFAFLFGQVQLLLEQAAGIARALPGQAAAKLTVTFSQLATSIGGVAEGFEDLPIKTAALESVQKKLAESNREQEETVKLLTGALSANKIEIDKNVAAVNALDNETSSIIANINRATEALKQQAEATKDVSAATRQATADAEKAAQAFKTEVAAVLAFGLDPRDTGFGKIQEQLASIGPNAIKAGQDFEVAFEKARTASEAIGPEQFAVFEQQTDALLELIRTFEMLPEAARASFDGQISAIRDGTKTSSEVLAEGIRADSLARRQAAARDLSVAGAVFGALANLAETEGKKGFEVAKGLRIAETIINGLAASIRVFADPTIPFGVAAGLSAAIIANTFATVQKIRATQPGGGGGGAGGGGLGGAGGGGGGQPTGLVVPAQEAEQDRGQQITISVAGFIGNEQELASQLSNLIREAQGDGVDFSLETSRG